MYKIQVEKKAQKDLDAIPEKFRKAIYEKVKSLAENPRPEGVKKLKGNKSTEYRIRHGDYRIIYEIKDHVLIILIVKVGHRRNIYR